MKTLNKNPNDKLRNDLHHWSAIYEPHQANQQICQCHVDSPCGLLLYYYWALEKILIEHTKNARERTKRTKEKQLVAAKELWAIVQINKSNYQHRFLYDVKMPFKFTAISHHHWPWKNASNAFWMSTIALAIFMHQGNKSHLENRMYYYVGDRRMPSAHSGSRQS